MTATKIVNKKNFEVETEKFCVVRPDAKLQEKAQLFKARRIREAAEGGALLREEVGNLLRSRKVWDDEKEKLYLALAKSLKEDEAKLAKAKKVKMKLSEAKDLALKMANSFQGIQTLQAERSSLDHLTAEGMASGAEYDFLLAHCVRKADGTPYYVDYDDMTGRDVCPVYEKAKEVFMDLLYGPYEEQLKRRPEWKFLLSQKMVNENLRLIDKDGKTVDGLGRRVDDKGRLINADGKWVNDAGELVDELGFLVEDEDGYFTDDEGKPIGQTVCGKVDAAETPEAIVN